MLNRRSFFTSCGTIAAAGSVIALPSWAQAQVASSVAKAGALNEESLGTLLTTLGLKPTKNEQRYDFDFTAVIAEEEWALSMSTVLSQDGNYVWIMAWLDELPKSSADVPRTALLRLLSLNDTMGKGRFFAYINSNRRFVLQQVIPNENMTAAIYRDNLKELGKIVVETFPVWSVANWNGAAPTTEGPSAATNKQTQAAPVSSSVKK